MINQIYAVKIHNNTTQRIVPIPVPNIDEGLVLLRSWIDEIFDIENDEEALSTLYNNYSYYNDEDPDNIYTFEIFIYTDTFEIM